jgi:hypothetical protein
MPEWWCASEQSKAGKADSNRCSYFELSNDPLIMVVKMATTYILQ